MTGLVFGLVITRISWFRKISDRSWYHSMTLINSLSMLLIGPLKQLDVPNSMTAITIGQILAGISATIASANIISEIQRLNAQYLPANQIGSANKKGPAIFMFTFSCGYICGPLYLTYIINKVGYINACHTVTLIGVGLLVLYVLTTHGGTKKRK